MASRKYLQAPEDRNQANGRRGFTAARAHDLLPARPPKSSPSLFRYTPLPLCPPGEGEMIVVNQGASGIGDALLGLTAVAGLQQQERRPVHYRVHPNALPFVALFHGWDALTLHDCDTPVGRIQDTPTNPAPHDRQINQGYTFEMGSRSMMPRIDRYCRNVGCEAPCIPPLREPDRFRQAGQHWAGVTVLCPCSRFDGRAWPLRNWRELERILLDQGHRVVLLGDDPNFMQGLVSDRVLGQSPEMVVSLLLAAATVVSTDSGMAHLAGILGRPTVVLCSVTDGSRIVNPYPSTLWLRGRLGCHACYWNDPYRDADCLPRCPSLAAITAPHVAAAVEIGRRLPGLNFHTIPGMGQQPCNRRATMTFFLRHVLNRNSPVMAETGCQRADPDPGTGESSRLFALAAQATNGILHSIDIDRSRLRLAEHVCQQLPFAGHHAEGSAWLENYGGRPIDGLYLDSCDCELPEHAEVCLAEAKAAQRRMAKDGVILIDDSPLIEDQHVGKGAAAIPWLRGNGWRIAAEGYQVALVRA